jgi:uncharacterized membrane protein
MNTDRSLRNFSIVTSLIGLVDSLYLTWIKFSHREAFCLPGIGDCETVNTSRYAEFYGIPVALLGALTYVVILLVLTAENRTIFSFPIKPDHCKMAVFGISLFGVIYSGYLTYVELVVLQALCPFCVISAITILIIFIIAAVRLINNPQKTK